jgi:hypothetical protein
MDLIGLYKKMILSLVPENLKKQLSSEKGEIGEGIKYYLLAALVVDIIFLISMGLQIALSGAGTALEGGYGDATGFLGLSVVLIVGILILIPVMMVVGSLITTGLGYILCRILGGTGTYANQFYHFAVVGGGLAVVNSIVGLVPCIGSLITLALSLYYIYPTFLIYRSVHKLSNTRAGFVALFPLILAIILLVVAVVLFASAMTALLGSMSSMNGGSYPY